MKEDVSAPNRREMIGIAMAATGGVMLGTATPAAGSEAVTAGKFRGDVNDWDWLVGKWNVRHRRLRTRLASDTEWEEFDGTCKMWPTMGGVGNIDDNVLHIPSGTYRAVGIRAFDPENKRWAIWWLDERNPTRIEPPVFGGFENGVGTFIGEDVFNGNPILVRFKWSDITQNSARWDQAFSPDGGVTWETNWIMHFSRAE